MTDKELDRNAARRLPIIKHAQEVTGNVALTGRYYGISRQVFYRWHRRYQEEGLAGLRDRSKRPLTSPDETPAEVVGKIIYLRTNYHFGSAKISMYLKSYHDIDISQSGVWRILQRVDLSRLGRPTNWRGGAVTPRECLRPSGAATWNRSRPILRALCAMRLSIRVGAGRALGAARRPSLLPRIRG